MMAVTLTVGGDVHQLRFVALRRERSHKAFGKMFAAGKQPFKGDGAGNRSVVKKQRDSPPRGQPLFVRACRIDLAAADIVPSPPTDAPHSSGLVGCENGESYSELREDLQSLQIHGGLRQPHALRRAPETPFKISNAPEHLGMAVASIGEGKNHVMIGLGQRRAGGGEVFFALL